ncbi:MAG: protocatechuate 4,5-dioxygenase subunit alpha [Burkholderiales bacterium]
MASELDPLRPIPGTCVFDGVQSRRGYRINRFCMRLARAENRSAFKADEAAYLASSDLTEAEKALVRARDFRALGEAGGNTYFMIKLGACTGHGLYHIGAQMRGETYEQFLATRKVKGAT